MCQHRNQIKQNEIGSTFFMVAILEMHVRWYKPTARSMLLMPERSGRASEAMVV